MSVSVCFGMVWAQWNKGEQGEVGSKQKSRKEKEKEKMNTEKIFGRDFLLLSKVIFQ